MAPRSHVRRGDPTQHCDDCGAGPFTDRGLAAHVRLKHGEEGEQPAAAKTRESAGPSRRPVISDGSFRAETDKLVSNLSFVGVVLTTVLPTTGTTLLRRLPDQPVVDLGGQPVLVDGRPQFKRGIATIIMDLARRDERILTGVRKFNALFEANEVLELGLQLAASVAVDVGIDPDFAIPTPVGKITPIRSLIPDVLADLYGSEEDRQTEAQQMAERHEQLGDLRARAEESNGAAASSGAVFVGGGVQHT